MKRFLIISTLFLLPLIAFLVGAEYTLRQIPNDYNYKATWLDEHAQDVECIVLGSSHAYYGIQPTYFTCNTFNAAHVSQSLNFDNHILGKYESNMDALKYVILPISYFTLASSLEQGDEAWRVTKYVLYYDSPIDKKYHHYELKPLNINTLKRLGRFLIKGKNTISIDSLGWGIGYSFDKKSEDWKSSGAVAAKRHTKKSIDQERVHTNIAHIDNIIEIANRHHAKVVLLNTPTHKVYQEHLNEEQWQLMNNVCDSIALAHKNVYRLNYFSDSTFIDDDFFDADHLNEYGAKRLSIMLSNDLDSLGIIR